MLAFAWIACELRNLMAVHEVTSALNGACRWRRIAYARATQEQQKHKVRDATNLGLWSP